MSSTSFKISFTLDEQDIRYFRDLFRKAKRAAAEADRDEIMASARNLVETVRRAKKTPRFVLDAVTSIEDLVEIIEDQDYAAPKSVAKQVLGALAYFANPQDLIPDDVPVIGFLDDALMIKLVEREFKHELVAYRKFRRFRDGAEQRPWTKVAASRLPARLEVQRERLRADVERRKKADERSGALSF